MRRIEEGDELNFYEWHIVLSKNYLFAFEVDQVQGAPTLFSVNKHWALLVFHGRTPIVSVVGVSMFRFLRSNTARASKMAMGV